LWCNKKNKSSEPAVRLLVTAKSWDSGDYVRQILERL
jgi:hypothetical protein